MKTQHTITKQAHALGRDRIGQPSPLVASWYWLRLAAALALLLLAGRPGLMAADPPHLIPFQGHLARPSAADPAQFEPVPAGRYDILFTLYAAPVGGESKVWGPERHAQVTVVNGLINAMLGSVIGFQDAIADNPNFFARPLYVGITVDVDGNPNTADLELVPRQALLPSVYALNANKLDGFDWNDLFSNGNPVTGTMQGARVADQTITAQKIAPLTITSNQLAPGTVTAQQLAAKTVTAAQIADKTVTGAKIADNTITAINLHSSLQADSIVPPGTIVAFGGSAAPVGWLLCDGHLCSKVTYSNLWNTIGVTWGAGVNDFNVPDLRGRLLVGTGQGPGLTSRAMGGSGGEETHVLTIAEMPSHNHTWGFGVQGDDSGSGGSYDEFTKISGSVTDVIKNTGGGLSHTNMPPFRVVNYIIKY